MNPLPSIFPNGATGAVSLTYDDGLDSQLDHAVPDLDAAALCGTFFIPSRRAKDNSFLTRTAEWRAVAERGHEIGNHTQHHPCGGERPWLRANFRLEAYSTARIESELVAASHDLDDALGESTVGRSFAYPCGEDWVGPTQTSFRASVARLFPAGRAGEGAGGISPQLIDPYECDLSFLPAWSVSGFVQIEDLVAFVESAIEQHRWAVFAFRGVSNVLSAPDVRILVHRELCRHIALRRDVLWCAPFVTVAQHVRQATNRPWKRPCSIRVTE
jgi:hypothetical protein